MERVPQVCGRRSEAIACLFTGNYLFYGSEADVSVCALTFVVYRVEQFFLSSAHGSNAQITIERTVITFFLDCLQFILLRMAAQRYAVKYKHDHIFL